MRSTFLAFGMDGAEIVGHGRPVRRSLVACGIVSAFAMLLGCAATPIALTGGISRLDSRYLIYDELVLDLVVPSAEASMAVAAQTSGDGAREGLRMMLRAPVGCMQAGVFAPYCLLLAPVLPFVGASRVQDVATSEVELGAMAARVDLADIQRRFRDTLLAEANQAGVPFVLSARPGARVAILHAEFGHTILEHDGYENGSITVRQPYRFSLSYGDQELEPVIEGERFARYDVESWSEERTEELARDFDRWIRETATLGVRDTVLEWQPKVVLGPLAPVPSVRRSVVGIRQTQWPFVESTTPRLAWEPLDAVLDSSVLIDVSDISYELEIFHPRGSHRTVVGLDIPEYVVTEPLGACAFYLWRPVARFRYRGVVHTTSPSMRRWSETEFLSNDFVLKTPSADCEDPSRYDLEPPSGS